MSRVSDVKDTEQCYATLGDISCDKVVVCYLCGAPIIPHWASGATKNDHQCNTPTSSLWNFNKSRYKHPNIKPIYPQCEHIMPCNPKIGEIKIPGYAQHLSIVKIGIVYKSLHISQPKVGDPVNVDVSKLNEKDTYLNLILTLNYAWSHAYCNAPCKSNKILIDYSSIGQYEKHSSNITEMKTHITSIFVNKIINNINLVKKVKLTTNTPDFKDIDNRLDHIINTFNNINTYFPTVTDMTDLTKYTKNFFTKGGEGDKNKLNFIKILDALNINIKSISPELPKKNQLLTKIEEINSEIKHKNDDILFLNLNHLFLNLEDISEIFFDYLLIIIKNYEEIHEYSEYSRILNLKNQKSYELFIKFI